MSHIGEGYAHAAETASNTKVSVECKKKSIADAAETASKTNTRA